MESIDERYLSPTSIIDSDHEEIIRYAAETTGASIDLIEKAINIYYAVRDGIYYDPYSPFYLPEHYRASSVLSKGRGFCISKASLLCALGRASGIASRVGFATVRNHLATQKLIEHLGSDRFVFHAFTEFYLEGKWVKATPAFNIGLCEKHGVPPLEFNGREDAIFQSYSPEKKKFMEYLAYHGSYHDIPVDTVLAKWREAYGEDRVAGWINDLERARAAAEGEEKDYTHSRK